MTSLEYKSIIATIIRNTLKRHYPGLTKLKKENGKVGGQADICGEIARAVHARMYGANVDGVDSPIWHLTIGHDRPEPKIDATELLKEEITK